MRRIFQAGGVSAFLPPPSTWEMVGLGVEEGVNPPPPTPHPLNLCVYECVEYMGTLGGPLHYHACAGWE